VKFPQGVKACQAASWIRLHLTGDLEFFDETGYFMDSDHEAMIPETI